MLLSDTADVLVRLMPPVADVLLLIVPPEPAVDPMPVTVSPLVLPVVVSTIPEFAPAVVDVMLRNVRPVPPMVVLATFNAVPVVVAIVLTSGPVAAAAHGFSSQTSTVPPLVAVKAALAPVVNDNPPRNTIDVPSLLSRKIPVPVSVTGPLKVTAPLPAVVRPWMSMDRPALLVMVTVLAKAIGAVPPDTRTSAPLVLVKLAVLTLIAPPPDAVTLVRL